MVNNKVYQDKYRYVLRHSAGGGIDYMALMFEVFTLDEIESGIAQRKST
jgi:hypothetical protein